MNYRKRLDSLLIKRSYLLDRIEEESSELEKCKQHKTNVIEAQKLLQETAEFVQKQAHKQIANVVSRCLKAVLNEPYQLKINFVQKRGKTEAILSFVRGDLEIDPLSASGGGVVDLASFALRLSCLVLSKPSKRRLLVLDEGFKHLSENYSERVKEMLLTLSKEMGLQIIFVTHNRNLVCGKVVQL